MADSQREDANPRIPLSPGTYADTGRPNTAPRPGDTRPDSVYAQDDLRIPTIELPRGGGALKSIDEKFQVNAANGTVSLSVPLPQARPRRDLAPNLTLGYNSGSGNDVFGLGWRLSQAAIQRRTDKLLPAYADAAESDVFLLAGAEDMVPVLVDAGGGHWQPDEFVAPTGETVKRYRPRVEGAFARIERITPPGALSFYWKITTKDNTVTIYGRSAAARIADPANPARIFNWLPELSYNDKGDCLEYGYVPEDFQNVARALPERNRQNGLASCTNTYLKRVRYGNKNPYYANPAHPYAPQAPADPAYFFELVFDYGDHDPAAPTPAVQQPWPCRLDPFSDYKPGFEVRTYRLCQRVLLFHYFKELNDGVTPAPCAVRSLDFAYRYYANPAATPAELRNVEVDYPIAIRQTGWVKTGPASYATRSLPALQLTYQEPAWNTTAQAVSAADLENAPVGLSQGYQLTDLWSEGIAGILTEQGGAWFYKSNLGSGRFTPGKCVAPKPSFTGLSRGTLQLQDLEADGRKFLVVTDPPIRGAFELSDDGQWQPFAAFAAVPDVDLTDPDTRFIDLDGDGRADIAVSEENVFTWYPSAGVAGYGGPRWAAKPYDEESGPALVFSDPTGSIFLAGMSGSGLTDIVRIRNGEVCYWPNLGYGRFGAKVTMDFCPVFDTPDLFNPACIHLADVSGTGATDLLYLGKDRCRAWLNQSGNAWSEPAVIDSLPTTEQPNQLAVADFLGNGTACIVWSSPLPRYAAAPLQYVDLMGGHKPYLLAGYQNQAGKQVTLAYKSSTYFYLADKLAGKPWLTKLPFPVQCLATVSSRDSVTRAYLTTQYVYHHGYYDHAEREYRGFGCVEQTDTESFDEFVKSGGSVVDQPLYQAPVLTKTWYHTGVFFGESDLLALYRSEYYQNPAFAEYHLPPPQAPAGLSAQELREAQRACKGTTIRQEIYGLDNVAGVSTVPYSVAERNCLIQRLQPLGPNRYAVFLVTENESLSYTYERNDKDPRIGHTLNTAIDGYGNILQAATVAYPRQPGATGLPAPVQAEQQKLLITYATTTYTNDTIAAAAYRLRLPCATASYELTGVTPAATYFALAEIRAAFAAAAAIPYEATPSGAAQKRALKQTRTLFLKDDLSGPLALGQLQALGLAYEAYRLTFTATLLPALYGSRVTPAAVAEGAYIHSNDFKAAGLFPPSDADDEWWAHAGHATYPAAAAGLFYQPDAYLDPFGNATRITYYADYQLLIQAVTDPVGNITSVDQFDFRSLAPQRVRDANANFSEVRFDALGFVVGMALEGKGSEADDFTGFVADLAPAAVAAFFADPVTNGPALLQHATGRFVYDFSVVPLRVASIVRETHHQAAVASGTPSKLQYRFEYSDGFGNIAMRKVQAEPGIALALDASNNVIQVDTTPNLRWVGNGRTVLNNKGRPVKQYEPYFSVTFAYEDDPQLVEIGVTPLLYYDPPGRNVRTDYPNGTFAKTVIGGWLTQAFDQNDTVVDSDWYVLRTTGSLATNPQENQAAQKTAVHSNTPAQTHADGLGRAFYAVADNKFVDHVTHALTEQFYETYTVLDIEGKTRQIVDPRGNTVIHYDYDMLGNQGHRGSADAGERWLLNDCTGHALYGFDSKNHVFHTSYDALRRPVQATVAQGAAPAILFDRITYGEGQPGDQANNLRTRIFEHRDQSGILTNASFDFKGNLLQTNRVLTVGYQNDVDWNAPPPLQSEVFTTQTAYDALNRPVRIVAPTSNSATANVIVPTYNEAGVLETVAVQERGAAAATPFVNNIDYNEKGQRARIAYANGASTVYKYDPLTFRLIGLVTARRADPEQFWDDKSKITLPAFGGDVLQFLTYTFDPVGNITYIMDDAQQTIYFNNRRVEPSGDYTYDAIYRLAQSLGREAIGGQATPGPFDDPRLGNPIPGDGNALQTYTLQYDYDATGNLLLLRNLGNWSMAFTYAAANNQMVNAVPGGASGTPFTYPYDAHGNVTAMPHLTTIDWDFQDRLRHTAVSASGSVSQESWYTYDAGGQRLRKVVQKGNTTEERLYFGSIEIFRQSLNGTLALERETLHVMDDTRRIAMVDTPTVKPADSRETQLTRYQYANHLGSACLELDDAARIISYEEYYAFGSTSYQGTDQSREVPARRYRYTGKERDDDSGFYYHGARYYAPWLARWTAPDPGGIKAGLNLYAYCRGNPVILHDPNGTQDRPTADPGDDGPPFHYERPDPNQPLRLVIDRPIFQFAPLSSTFTRYLLPGAPSVPTAEPKAPEPVSATTFNVTQGASEPGGRATAEANVNVSQNAGGAAAGYTVIARYAGEHVSAGVVTTSSFSADTTSTATGAVVHLYTQGGSNEAPAAGGGDTGGGPQQTVGVYGQVTGGQITSSEGSTPTVAGTATGAYSVDFGPVGIDVNAVVSGANATQLADPRSTLLRSGVVGVGGSAALTLKGDEGRSGFMVEGIYSHVFGLGDPRSGTPSANVDRYGFNVGGFHNFVVSPSTVIFAGVTGGVLWESGSIQDPAALRGAPLPTPRTYNDPTVTISATVGVSF